jgi:hypothetical protein
LTDALDGGQFAFSLDGLEQVHHLNSAFRFGENEAVLIE